MEKYRSGRNENDSKTSYDLGSERLTKPVVVRVAGIQEARRIA